MQLYVKLINYIWKKTPLMFYSDNKQQPCPLGGLPSAATAFRNCLVWNAVLSLIVKMLCEKYSYLRDNFKAWELKCFCCGFEVIQLNRAHPVLMDSVKKGVVSYSAQFGDLLEFWGFFMLVFEIWAVAEPPKSRGAAHNLCLLAL